jgi:beta-glucosidase
VWVDNQLVFENARDAEPHVHTRQVALEADRRHRLVAEWQKTGHWGGFQLGWEHSKDPSREVPTCVELAAAADAAIVCVGFDHLSEGEGHDRPFAMDQMFEQLVTEVAAVQPNVVVVLMAGGNVDMQGWLGKIKGLIHAFYPGEQGGRAIAEILFGCVNPSGKLPITLEKRLQDRSSFESYHDTDGDLRVALSDGIFCGYRYVDAHGIEPEFPFGFGLSYTTFAYENLALSSDRMSHSESVTVRFDIVNTGCRTGAEIAQLYVCDEQASVPRPPKELKGFVRVELVPGERRQVKIVLARRAFEFYDPERHEFRVEPGRFEVLIGASATDLRMRVGLTVC